LNLRDILKAEAPGILAWLVRGFMEWNRSGLQPPKKILDAVAEYRDDEDDFGDFITERLIIDINATTPAAVLFSEYLLWTSTNNVKAMSKNAFGTTMGKRFTRKKLAGGNVYFGIRL